MHRTLRFIRYTSSRGMSYRQLYFPFHKAFFLNRKHCNTYTRVIFSSSDFFRNTCFPFELAHFFGRLLGPTRAYYVLLFPSDKPMQARNKQKLQRSNKPQYKKKTNKINKIHLHMMANITNTNISTHHRMVCRQLIHHLL